MTRWRVVLASTVILTLIVGHLLRDTPGYMVRNPDGTLSGDLNHYVYWTRLVTVGGIQSAYSGTWPETYAVYPPVTLYPLELIGNAYQFAQDPSFDPERAQNSLWLREAIKSTALAWHLLAGVALFVLLARFTAEKLAAVSAGLYLLNPAALYDVAHWGQPDGAHSLFSVLAIGWLELGSLNLAWVAVGLAALAKPQAWSILPLLGVGSLRQYGLGRLGVALATATLTATLVCMPFVLTGHLPDLLSLPGTISSVMPVVSADAHNAWWLWLQLHSQQDPIFVQDSARTLGPLSFRAVAALLVAASLLLACWLYWSRRASLAEAAALTVLGWFTFTTQAHENHLFFALPLLSLAWPTRHWLLVPFAAISLSVLLNMLLHDQLVLEVLGYSLKDATVIGLQLVNAWLNVLLFFGWSAVTATRPASRVEARLSYSLGFTSKSSAPSRAALETPR